MTPNGGKGAETDKERPEGDSGAMADIDSPLKSNWKTIKIKLPRSAIYNVVFD